MIPRLLLATSNQGKIRELRRLLGHLPVELCTPHETVGVLDVDESGATYEENARLKALAYAEASGLPTLGEDSGIEIDALDGAPGIYSARFEGLPDGPEKNAYVLKLLDNVPPEQRGARYVCSMVLMMDAPLAGGRELITFEGMCPGHVALAPAGQGGFGYDPIFLVPRLDRTMAELTDAQKDRVSHRGRAARKLAGYLEHAVK